MKLSQSSFKNNSATLFIIMDIIYIMIIIESAQTVIFLISKQQ